MSKTILLYDLHASESGALAILEDFYNEVADRNTLTHSWDFIISTPTLETKSNIKVSNYPWVKKGWIYRLLFEYVYEKRLIAKSKPDILVSLQNKGVKNFKQKQIVYLHLSFILTDYRFRIKKDGFRLWLYQKVFKHLIINSYRDVDIIVVQTAWMKQKLKDKLKKLSKTIKVVYPKIDCRLIKKAENVKSSRIQFFYPATAFAYKNHQVILEACKFLKGKGVCNYDVIFTLNSDSKNNNRYEKKLISFIEENQLNNNVRFTGTIPRERVFDFYTRSVLLFPSLVESFGMPLLEGRLSNSIIFAADTPFANEILTDYSNAYFFSPSDYTQLALLMEKLIRGEIIQQTKEDMGVKRFMESKTLVDVINEMLE